MKNASLIISILLIMAVLTAGCLETKEAEPATVNQATLDRLGWVQSGEVQKDSMTRNIGGIEIVINTARVDYYDKALADDINQQIRDLMRVYGGSTNSQEQGQISSQFITLRLTLPAGITIPESVLMGIIDTLIQKMAQENDIQNFHEVGEESVTISTGSTVKARSYEGYIKSEDENAVTVNIRGVVASWSGEGTTTIVIGVIPAEDLTLKVPAHISSSGTVTININEDREYQDILTLIQNVD